MTTIRAKIFDVFRNLKSDAVPQAPRAKESEKQDSDSDVTDTHEEHNNEEYVEQDEEEIVINLEGFSGTENAKNKSYGSSKKKEDIPKSEKKKKTHTDYNNVNTHGRYPYKHNDVFKYIVALTKKNIVFHCKRDLGKTPCHAY